MHPLLCNRNNLTGPVAASVQGSGNYLSVSLACLTVVSMSACRNE